MSATSPVHHETQQRAITALESVPSRIPVVIGTCGTGRSTVLQQLARRYSTATYVDLERVVSTPERLAHLIASDGGEPIGDPPGSPRDAFDQVLALWGRSRPSGPVTFLLDEILALKTFESFPGLRDVMRDVTAALAASPNRFVLSSRYLARTYQLLRDIPGPFETIELPRLTATEILLLVPARSSTAPDGSAAIAHSIERLSQGRLRYAQALAGLMSSGSTDDATQALTSLFAPRGELALWCEARCEARLQRTRGYGTLKALLELLAEEEPLTLSELAERLQRSLAATKTYLSWLQDVDLIIPAGRFYAFADPLLRLWVRLYCRPAPPTVERVWSKVRAYAETCLATGDDPAPLTTAVAARRRSGIIEID